MISFIKTTIIQTFLCEKVFLLKPSTDSLRLGFYVLLGGVKYNITQ